MIVVGMLGMVPRSSSLLKVVGEWTPVLSFGAIAALEKHYRHCDEN
jgi:hypothetical protein